MTITATERADILELVALMFNAAPGAAYLSDIVTAYEAGGRSIASLAQVLSQTPAFQAVHPNFETANEFATKFLSTVGLQNDAVARDWVVSQFNAGASKAAIISAGWAILDGVTEPAQPQYLAARAMMENKAAVADYYSVVMREASLDLAVLQDVLVGVTPEPASVDAAIRELSDGAAQGAHLTPGADNVQVGGTAYTVISGLVDGNAADGQSGTYTAGDRIRGNGHTDVELTVIDGGAAGYVRMENIDTVSLVAGTDDAVTFNAGGWEGVGSVRLASGVNGMAVLLNNLEAGTGFSISHVRGSIGANQRLDDGRVLAQLVNADRRGEGGSYRLSADGDIDAQMADRVSLGIETRGDVALGDVAVQGGSDANFTLRVEDGDDVSVGLVDVSMGDDVSATIEFADIEGDIAVGGVAVEAGDESSVSVRLGAPEGDVTIGRVDLTAGNESSVSLQFSSPEGSISIGATQLVAGHESTVRLEASASDDVSVGSIRLEAGDESVVAATFAASGEAAQFLGDDVVLKAGVTSTVQLSASGYASVVLGDLTLEAGDESVAAIDIEGEGEDASVSLGNVSMTLGADSAASFAVSAFADISAGDVAQTVGDAASASVMAQASQAIAIGKVTQDAGHEAVLASTLQLESTSGDLAWDGYAAHAGDASSVSVAVGNNGPRVGATTIGDIAASLGDDSRATVNVLVTGELAPTEDDPRPTAGDFAIGDIALSLGSVSAIDGDSTAAVSLLYGGKGDGAELGNIAVGDVHLDVGSGFVSGTLENHASATLQVAALAGGKLGGGSFGDMTLEGGDFASLQAIAGGAVYAQEGASIGNAAFADVTFAGGEAASMQAMLFWGGVAADSVGDMTVGNITALAKEDANFDLAVLHGVVSGTATYVGDLRVGNIGATLGDNSHAAIAVWDRARHAGDDADVNGDFFIGDIDVAVSATSPQDQSGGSSITVSLRKEALGLADAHGGAVSIGDISLTGGDRSDVSFALSYSGTMASAGDVTIGDIALHVGEEASAASLVRVRNAGGDIGSVVMGGHSLTLGKNATGTSMLVLDHGEAQGDTGNIDIGDISLSLANGAQGRVSLAMAGATAEADVGNYSIGDVTIEAGAGAIADLAGLDVTAGAVGNVSIGNTALNLGEGAAVVFDTLVSSVTRIGSVSVGDRVVNAAEDAIANLRVGVSAETTVAAVTIGSVAMDLSQGAKAQVGADIAAAKVGGTTIGDTNVTVTDGAAANIAYRIEGDIGLTRVGDIHLVVGDAGALTDDTEDAAEMPGSISFLAHALGDSGDHLIVGDISIEVGGTAEGDRVFVGLQTNGNLTIGDLTVSGEGIFSFKADDADAANTSVLAVSAGGTRTIGDVDFSGYGGDADIDLSWTTAGAATITGGDGKDTIKGNSGANVIAAGKGVDVIDITQGGNDTIVTSRGDSGKTATTLDTVIGFTAGSVVSGALTGGDRLDFNLLAGSAGNYVERSENFGTFDEFLANARDVLNSTVRYFAQDDGVDTYVAVNYGSGEADLVIRLAGVSDATALQFQNFIA